MQNTAVKTRRSRRVLKLIKDREWLNSPMDDAEHTADMGNKKTLYEITKAICNGRTHKNTTINDKDGKTITDDSSRLARWKEHFEEILNRPPLTNPIVITADEVPEIDEISTRQISKGEVKKAISSQIYRFRSP